LLEENGSFGLGKSADVDNRISMRCGRLVGKYFELFNSKN